MCLSYVMGAQCLALEQVTNELRPVRRSVPLMQLSHITAKLAAVCMSA